jgi:arylsulfatase A-like enzyme
VPTFDNILAEHGYHTEYYGKWHTPYKFAATYKNKVRQTSGRNRGVLTSREAYLKYLDEHIPRRDVRPGELIDNSSLRPYKPDPLDWRYGMTQEQSDKLRRQSKRKSNAGRTKLFSQAGSYGCLDIPADHSRTAFTAKEVIAAIERIKDKPFSLTCSFGPPHPPMVVPRPYYDMYKVNSISAPVSIDDPMDNSPYSQRARQEEMKRYRNKTHVRRMISNYYGMVREIDDWVGRILNKLRQLGLEDNTLVIFTSDHGEMSGDHGLHSKMVLYEASAHIPLIARLPGAVAAGTVVYAPVSHVDLFATILDYLRMPFHKSDGRSLRNLIEGKGDDGIDYCVSEWGASRGPTLMIRTKDFKYICSHSSKVPSVDALYNLIDDPHEMNNLIGANPEREKYKKQVEMMRTRLISWLEKIDSPRLEDFKERCKFQL